MTKNLKKPLDFDQNKHKWEFERIKIFQFITSKSNSLKKKMESPATRSEY